MSDKHDIVVQENRRLQKEVRLLRERVAAYETSRWWRLHPRMLLRRLPGLARSGGRAKDTTVVEKTPAPYVDPLVARFRTEIFERGDFTRDWFTRNIPIWEPVLEGREGRSVRALELGSFEGLAACFLLWRLPDARVTCVDNFVGPPEYAAYGETVLEERFDANVALVDASRVRKRVGQTGRVLLDLVEERERFDFVYVDASHRALDVMVDACLVWQLVASGGTVIFDDYDWVSLGDDDLLRPAPAIDAFLDLVSGHSEVVVRHPRQVALRKTAVPEVGTVAAAES